MRTITEPGIYPDLANADYHAQDGLSASGAKRLGPTSAPALFAWERDHPVYKEQFDFGSLVHKLVLQDEQEVVQVIDAPDWRSKDARTARDEARVAGVIPCLTHEYEQAVAMRDALLAHPTAKALLNQQGRAEVSLFNRDPATGVMLRARVDWLPDTTDRRLILVDYKTARSAAPQDFRKAVVDYGYHQQAPWYVDLATSLGLAPEPAFVFIVQEKTPPYLPAVYELDVEAYRIGRLLNRHAIDTYAAHQQTGQWPGYPTDVTLLSLPVWYERQIEDALA